MMRQIPQESRETAQRLAEHNITAKDIAILTGMSERTIKRNFNKRRRKVSPRRLNDTQKREITRLHHIGKDFITITKLTNLPARAVLNFLKNMFQEGWTVKRCPVCGQYKPMKQNRLSVCEECKSVKGHV